MSHNNDVYFASLPADELADELMNRIDEYYRSLEDTGMLRKFRKSYDQYYGYSLNYFFSSSSDVGYGGEQGEIATVKVNHYRNLLQHILVMTTSTRPALEARATNDDVRTQAQCILANGILEYYMRDKRLERYLKAATEQALLFGEGYIHIRWNPILGEPYGINPETGEPIREGDLEFSNPLGPLEIVTDPKVSSQNDVNWRIVLERVNKYDLASQFPEKKEQILAQVDPFRTNRNYTTFVPGYKSDSDYIILWRFYHKRTQSMPQGREFWVLAGDLWLLDGPLPYDNLPGGLPVFRITPSDFFGSSYGYTSCWDIIGISEVIDSLHSAITTNQTTFAVQNIIAPKGSDINYQQLAGGLNYLEYDPQLGKPEALQLTATPPEVFKYIEALENTSQLLIGVNSVVRGDPQASLKSGSALALVASQAVQFNSGLQASYSALLEDVGTAVIRFLQTFATTRRVVSIAGKSKLYMLKEFTKDDLSEVNRVVVDVANPLSRTVAGRLELAQNLLQVPGLLKRPEQFLQVAETGKLDPLIEGEQAELMNIRSENEQMSSGQPVQALATDKHSLHINEHKTVLATPDARKNPNLVQAVLTHLQEHIQIIKTTDPTLLAVVDPDALNILAQAQQITMGQAAQQQQGLPPGPPPQEPPLEKPNAPSRPDGAPAAPALQAENPLMAEAAAVDMPKMPANPQTGERG